MTEVVIVSAVRTPIGAFNGGLATVPAHELGALVIAEGLKRADVGADEVSEVVLGQVLTAGQGQNPARQAAIKAGIPADRTAMTINQVCGSGLRAVAMGYQAIRNGDSAIVIAGGQESMSLSTHCAYLRSGTKMGGLELVDTMIKDGLWDAFNGYHMGTTAENVAQQWQITRQQQDEFAAASQRKAGEAMKAGRFKDEIVPVTVKGRRGDTVVENDEHPKPESTADVLAKLRPAFSKDGSVTAGNASGLNDAASAVVLATGAAVQARGLKPLARLVAYAHAGVDPKLMGLGPVPASRLALKRAGLGVNDLDVVESNEAFAAQACAVARALELDPAKVNPNGSGISLGHPVGATGAIITTKALYELQRIQGRYALVTMCIGGGQGIAAIFERA
jgi:acetyl-CoA C-acetyltransferase